MSGPSSVCDTGMGVKDLGHVRVLFFDELLELGNLANLFEGKDFILLVAVNSQTCRVIASIFKTRETLHVSADGSGFGCE